MSSDTPIKLRLPQQDGESFSAFPLTAEGARVWVQRLPVANTGAAVQQFQEVLGELNRVVVEPENRFSILEVLRPGLSAAMTNLSRTFLNQPLVMSPEQRRAAELAARLYDMASVAYTVVGVDAVQTPARVQSLPPALLVCQALQRALAFTGRKFLQTFQLYRAVELNDWLELHQLYSLAEQQHIHDKKVRDPLLGNRDISATYLQTVILGCCKANQLRPGELLALHRALRDWSQYVTISPPERGQGLFMVDLYSDKPPLYSSLYSGPGGDHCRYIDTSALVNHLEKLKNIEKERGGKGILFNDDIVLPARLLDHMIEAMSQASTRNFSRKHTGRPLLISIGLSGAHYHLSGEKSFNELLHGEGYIPGAGEKLPTQPFLDIPQKRDVWHQANPEEDFAVREAGGSSAGDALQHQVEVDARTAAVLEEEGYGSRLEQVHPAFQIETADVSPGGYCLQWSDDLPGDILPGRLATIREEGDDTWSLAVLRWISRLEGARTLVGLELLSPKATPYGALVQKTKGDTTVPMRVLMLPEIGLVGQPETLITPQAGFHEKQKLTLLREGQESRIQLQEQVIATGSFRRFTFRRIQTIKDVVAQDKSGPLTSPYDSVWSNI